MRPIDDSRATSEGKVITLNYDAITALPGDRCLFCLSDKDQMVLLALIETVSWRTRWYSPTGQTIEQAVINDLKGDMATNLMVDQCETIQTNLDEILEAIQAVDGKVDTAITKIDGVQLDLNTFQADEVADDIIKDAALLAISTELTALSAAVALDSAAIAGIALLLTSTSNEVHDVHEVVDAILIAVDLIDCSSPVFNLEIITNFNDNLMIQIVLAALALQSDKLPGKTWLDKEDDGSNISAFAAYCALVNMSIQWIRTVLYRFIYLSDPANSALGALYNALVDAGGYFTGSVFDNAGIPSPPSTADAVTASQDDAAILTVACDLVAALLTRSLAFADWQAAVFTLTTYTDPSNEKVIADLLIAVAALDNLIMANYAGFITAYPEAYGKAYATNPTSFDDCGCA